MGIPILDTILMQRVAGQCIWIPRASLFLALLAGAFLIPVVQWLAIGVLFLCLARVVMRNVALSRQVAVAAELCGKTYRYFNEKALGTNAARKRVAEALEKDVAISLDAIGNAPALRFEPASTQAREAMALACAVVYYYGDCAEEPVRDATGITLKVQPLAHDPERRALYDRMLEDVLGTPLDIFSSAKACASVDEVLRETTPVPVAAVGHEEAIPNAILKLDHDLWLEIERAERGIALRSCSPEGASQQVIYGSARELLQTWGAQLDPQQRELVLRVARA